MSWMQFLISGIFRMKDAVSRARINVNIGRNACSASPTRFSMV